MEYIDNILVSLLPREADRRLKDELQRLNVIKDIRGGGMYNPGSLIILLPSDQSLRDEVARVLGYDETPLNITVPEHLKASMIRIRYELYFTNMGIIH